jgi:UDP-N-acetyl-D-mannosaminuronic acid dehydrogenase
MESKFCKTVCVVGLGYVGLPTAAIISNAGIRVIGVDVNKNVVDTINRGEIHIVEPDLGALVKKSVESGLLIAKTKPQIADIFIIAVPTPIKADKTPDLSFVESAAQAIAPYLKSGDLLILESTSPVGTTEMLSQLLADSRADLTFPHTHGSTSCIRLAYCPERILPGNVIREIVSNDRIIGGLSDQCSKSAENLYKRFITGQCFITSSKTAELCKLTENSFRDVNIAFANELSMICESAGVNVWELIKLANKHPRVNILQPSAGVGGHCIAVDPWFIVSAQPNKARLIKTARNVNDAKPAFVVEKVLNSINQQAGQRYQRKVEDITIGIFGLSFKPNIDDFRESPALEIATKISRLHAGKVLLVEPYLKRLPDGFGDNSKLSNIADTLMECSIAVILVAHKEFFSELVNVRSEVKIIDVCGIFR